MDGTTAGQIGLTPLGYPPTQPIDKGGTLSVNHALTTPLIQTTPAAAVANNIVLPQTPVQPKVIAPIAPIATAPLATTQTQNVQPPAPAYAPPMPPVSAPIFAMQSAAKPVEAFALPTIINIPSEPMLPPALPVQATVPPQPQPVATPAQNPAMADAASMAQEQRLQQVENKLLDVDAPQVLVPAIQSNGGVPMPPIAAPVATAAKPAVVPVAAAPKPTTSVSDYFQNNAAPVAPSIAPQQPKFNLRNINPAVLKKIGIIAAIVIVLGVGGYFAVHAIIGSHTTKTAPKADTTDTTNTQNTPSSDSSTNPTTTTGTDTTTPDTTTSGTSQGDTTTPVTTTPDTTQTTPVVTPTPTPAPTTPTIPDTGVQ